MPVRPRCNLGFDDLALDGGRQRLAFSERQPEVLRPLHLLLKCRDLLGRADGAVIGLHSGRDQANWSMASIKRAAAAILVRGGVDYAQSKSVFRAARDRAGLRASPERRGGADRLTVEEVIAADLLARRRAERVSNADA